MDIALILDDHKFFADSFAVMMEHNGFVEAAYAFTQPENIRKYIIQHREGNIYLFLDYLMRDINTLQLINDVRRLHSSLKVIIISSVTNPPIIKKILSYKPEGFISKTAGLGELADCFSSIKRKTLYVSPFLQGLLAFAPRHTLADLFTTKEMEILDRLTLGENIETMAQSLNLSRNTIISHRRNMLAKAGVKSVTALLALAIQEGLITNSQT